MQDEKRKLAVSLESTQLIVQQYETEVAMLRTSCDSLQVRACALVRMPGEGRDRQARCVWSLEAPCKSASDVSSAGRKCCTVVVLLVLGSHAHAPLSLCPSHPWPCLRAALSHSRLQELLKSQENAAGSNMDLANQVGVCMYV